MPGPGDRYLVAVEEIDRAIVGALTVDGRLSYTDLAERVGLSVSAVHQRVRRLEQRMIEAISREGDWRSALFDNAHTLLQPVGATGAALLFEGETLTAGEVPATADLRAVGRITGELVWVEADGPVSIDVDLVPAA